MSDYGYKVGYWKNDHFVGKESVENPLNVFFLPNK